MNRVRVSKKIAKTPSLWLMVLLLAGCTGSTPAPIVIGHVSDKTRVDKAGDQAELGIRLALYELTQDGTIADAFGGRKIEVHHTDTRGKLDAFESQAVRLDSVNKSLVIFGGLSPVETSALNNAKVPLLTFHGQPTSGANNQVFYLGISPSRQGTLLAKYTSMDAKATKFALLLDERRPESTPFAEAFQAAMAEARKDGNTEVALTRFGNDIKWSEILERLNAKKPNVIAFAGSSSDFNNWHRAMKLAYKGGDVQVVYAGNDGEFRTLDLEGDRRSILMLTALDVDPANEKVAAFRKAFRDAYPDQTADVNAALAYDGFRMMVEALKRTPTQLTPEKLREELLKTKDFPGLTGSLTIGADRQVQRTVYVVRWQNGKLTPEKTFAP